MRRAFWLWAAAFVGCVPSEVECADGGACCPDGAVLDEAGECRLPCTSGRSQDRFSCGICNACLAYPRESPGGRAYSYPTCPYQHAAGTVCLNATTSECHDSVCDP